MSSLSDREIQLLSLAADGFTDEAIGQQLGISVPTIRGYWLRIRTKLGGNGRAQLVGQWVQQQSDERDSAVAQDHLDLMESEREGFETALANERIETDLILGLLDEETKLRIAELRKYTDGLLETGRTEGVPSESDKGC